MRGKKFFECPRNYCKFVPVREVLCVVSEGKVSDTLMYRPLGEGP